LAVHRARFELPLTDSAFGLLGETHRQAFDHPDLVDVAVLVDRLEPVPRDQD
jgi:hypothetical protein